MPTGKAQTELSTQYMDYARATRPAISWNEYNDYRNIFVSGLQLLPPLSATQILLQKIGLASHPSRKPNLVMDIESSARTHPSPRSKRCRYGSLVVNPEIQEVSTCFVVEDAGYFKVSVSEAPELQEWERKVGTNNMIKACQQSLSAVSINTTHASCHGFSGSGFRLGPNHIVTCAHIIPFYCYENQVDGFINDFANGVIKIEVTQWDEIATRSGPQSARAFAIVVGINIRLDAAVLLLTTDLHNPKLKSLHEDPNCLSAIPPHELASRQGPRIFTAGYNGDDDSNLGHWMKGLEEAAAPTEARILKEKLGSTKPKYFFNALYRTISFGDVCGPYDDSMDCYKISATAWHGRSGGMVGGLKSNGRVVHVKGGVEKDTTNIFHAFSDDTITWIKVIVGNINSPDDFGNTLTNNKAKLFAGFDGATASNNKAELFKGFEDASAYAPVGAEARSTKQVKRLREWVRGSWSRVSTTIFRQ